MKKILVLFTMFYIFLSVTNVKAADCSYNELKELKQLAKKVEIGYSPSISEDGKNANFSLYVYNLDSRLKMTNPRGNYINGDDSLKSDGEFVVITSAGTQNKFIVYASGKTNCEDERVGSFSVELPIYNPYSAREECKGNEKKDICKRWYDSSSVSEEKFLELLNTAKEKEEKLVTRIVNILLQSPIALISAGIYIVIVIIAIIIFKRKKVKIDI